MTFKSRSGEIIKMSVALTDVRAVDATQGVVTAYANVFNVKDSYGSMFMPGAFTDSIKNGVDKIKVLWNHDCDDLPLGKLQSAVEDQIGLKVEMKFSLSVQRAMDVFQLIIDGVVNTMSIGFRILDDGFEDGVWVIRRVELMEVSPVNFASNPLAVITEARSESENTGKILDSIRNLNDQIQLNKAVQTLRNGVNKQ